jgi:uncharacterized membrane protein YcaP (DUF421 family)
MLLIWNSTLLQIALRTAIVFVAVIAALRLFGKRELGQLSTFDFALLLLIANTVQNSMTGPDTSLDGGIVAAGMLLALDVGLSAASARWHWFRQAVIGVPTVLVSQGKVNERALRREDITHEELRAALLEHGVEKLADVALAVLEVDGSVSVVPKTQDAVTSIKNPELHHRQRGRERMS